MSVQRYEAADGTRWRVRWRDENRRMRSKTFASKSDANGFDAEVKAKKFRGDLLPRPGTLTLAGAFEEWWRLRGVAKAATTRSGYRAVWDANIRGRHDHLRVSALVADPQLIEELVAEMTDRGVGPASRRKTLVVLSAVLSACVDWKRIPVNPIRISKLAGPVPQPSPRPLAPIVVERIRQAMRSRQTKDRSGGRAIGDACLVSVLAYAGLRPQECLALTWGDVGRRTITVDKALSLGEIAPTKTRTSRTAPLVAPLADDLAEWRVRSYDPPDGALIFPSPNGGYWSPSEINNWRSRVWREAVKTVAGTDPNLERLAKVRPYECRGSFVSLHLRADASALEVARWAGHSPQVMWRHYAGVIDELVGEPRISAEDQIINARDALATRDEPEATELVAESLKPFKQASPSARRLLYGPPRPRTHAGS